MTILEVYSNLMDLNSFKGVVRQGLRFLENNQRAEDLLSLSISSPRGANWGALKSPEES